MKNYTEIKPKSTPNNKTDKYLILTFFLILFHLVGNSLWITQNKNPLDYDPIGHTFASINSAQYVKTHLFNFSLKDYMKISPGYPNFVHTATLPLIFLFGNNWRVIQFSGTIFFLLSIFAVYLYISEISKSKKIGFFTAFFYSFFISVVQYSRFHMLDIPLTAMFFLTLFFWERYKKVNDYRYLYAGAITLAFAQLSKWHAFIFFIVPGLFLLHHLFKNKRIFNRSFLFHFICSSLLSILIFIPWYFYNFSDFIRLGTINYLGEPDDPHNLLSLENLLFYLKLIIEFQIGFIGFIFLTVSLVLIDIKKKKYLYIPLLTLFFSYIFFTFFVLNKNIRVIFPVMPLIALIMAEGANKFFTWLVVIYMILVFFILSFGVPFYPNYRYTRNLPIFGWIDLVYLKTYPVNLLYSKTSIPYKDISNKILSKSSKNKPIRLLVAMHQPFFHEGHIALQVYTEEQNNIESAYSILNNKIKILDINNILTNNESLPDSLQNVDIILTAEKNPIHPEEKLNTLYDPLKKIQTFLLSGDNILFSQDASFPLPDNDNLILFTNRRFNYPL